MNTCVRFKNKAQLNILEVACSTGTVWWSSAARFNDCLILRGDYRVTNLHVSRCLRLKSVMSACDDVVRKLYTHVAPQVRRHHLNESVQTVCSLSGGDCEAAAGFSRGSHSVTVSLSGSL